MRKADCVASSKEDDLGLPFQQGSKVLLDKAFKAARGPTRDYAIREDNQIRFVPFLVNFDVARTVAGEHITDDRRQVKFHGIRPKERREPGQCDCRSSDVWSDMRDPVKFVHCDNLRNSVAL